METQLQFDDDTLYAEIRRQILLLTSEDNEDLEETRRFDSIRVVKSGSTRSSVYYKSEWQGSSNFCSWETGSTAGSPPDWLVNLWKNGKGTGVFIPQAVAYSRKQRQGTMNSRRRVYRPIMNKDRRI
ncbi:hypothetical protein PIB30_029400 [Stylosanthes scabra]|uniref:Uncharacterized protein n=1 Tax=Stylosanthes scabra TaxID=79078 RepID=A0ABU6V9K1_9FABA|nr:hypothetical protein [Stylosanthes scabra]